MRNKLVLFATLVDLMDYYGPVDFMDEVQAVITNWAEELDTVEEGDKHATAAVAAAKDCLTHLTEAMEA